MAYDLRPRVRKTGFSIVQSHITDLRQNILKHSSDGSSISDHKLKSLKIYQPRAIKKRDECEMGTWNIHYIDELRERTSNTEVSSAHM